MTKKELIEIQEYLEDLQSPDGKYIEETDVVLTILNWIKQKYHEQAPKKLENYNKNL